LIDLDWYRSANHKRLDSGRYQPHTSTGHWERSELIVEPNIVEDHKPARTTGKHSRQMVSSLPQICERLRSARVDQANQVVDLLHQSATARIPTQGNPVHPTTKSAKHPPVCADKPRHSRLAKPARPVHGSGDSHRSRATTPSESTHDPPNLDRAIHDP
jgi:hypothetical protein